MQRTETPELTALAAKYPGVLLISKGDVAVEEDNKVHFLPRYRPRLPRVTQHLASAQQAAVDVAMQSFGRLDALICANPAAVCLASPFAKLTNVNRRSERRHAPPARRRLVPFRPAPG